MSKTAIVRNHILKHISELRVDRKVFRARFAGNCEMGSCRGQCCRLGADVDVGQSRRILAHADVIVAQMDTNQERNPENWFSEQFADPDFPSGQAVSTRVRHGGCVFLNKENRCVLHLAEQKCGDPDLKPFYCRSYPLCLEESVLTIDDQVCIGETRCCGASDDGMRTIFDICAFELEYMLGKDGVEELRLLAASP